MTEAQQVARVACGLHLAAQKEDELSAFLEVMEPLKPQVVVEVGCGYGGTLYAWSQLHPRLLIGISDRFPENFHGARILLGNSHHDDTRRRLRGLLGENKIDLLFIDAEHAYEDVRQDFLMYGSLVGPGGVVAFHDICTPPNRPDFGVERLWNELGMEKHAIITDPPVCGGIGWIRKPLGDAQ